MSKRPPSQGPGTVMPPGPPREKRLGGSLPAGAGPLDDSDVTAPLAVTYLDPRCVRPSVFANRHPRSFASSDFERLRSSIAKVGGNIQAVKVRPLTTEGRTAQEASAADPPLQFELIFGHRRHRACLELGIPVAAMVEEMSDRELLAEMDRENRTHRPLSPFEQGSMFKLALELALYPSARALATDLDVDESLVSKALSIARLPDDVIQAFPSPLEIQYRWAGPLNEACRKDPDGLTARARFLQADLGRLSAVRVYQRLVTAPAKRPDPVARRIAGRHGKALMDLDRKGRLVVSFEAPWEADLPQQIESAVREILNRR